MKVPAIQIPPEASLKGVAQVLGLPPYYGAIAVVGGAAGFDTPQFQKERKAVGLLLVELADVASKHRLVVVDGGTHSGYMQILGETRAIRRHDFSLIGVAPLGCITWAGRPKGWKERLHAALQWLNIGAEPAERAILEANHELFVLVEAHKWGAETSALAEIAYELAGGRPSVEVLINGGEISRRDVSAYLKGGGHVITLEGSGRFADELALAYRRGKSRDVAVQSILDTGRVHIFSLDSEPGAFRALLQDLGGWQTKL